MTSDSFSNGERVGAWCRSKTGLVAFTFCAAVILVFVGIVLSSQTPLRSNLESFVCRFSSSAQTYSIEVKVDLSDGMDQDEATSVAVSAFKEKPASELNPEEQLESFGSNAVLGSDGLWTVKLRYTRMVSTWPSGHIRPTILVTMESFEAVIDPVSRTVECSAI